MNACVLYFSLTGNTRKFAETISDSLKIQAVYDITTTEPSVVADYDVIIFGTPVHGFNPSKESISFVETLTRRQRQENSLVLHVPPMERKSLRQTEE